VIFCVAVALTINDGSSWSGDAGVVAYVVVVVVGKSRRQPNVEARFWWW